MKQGQTSKKAVEHVGEYIDNRLMDANKMKSALMANYSESTARNPSLIERTQAYQETVALILTENTSTMHILARMLNDDAKKGLFDDLKPLEKAQLYKIITETNDKLTPKITVKQSTDAKGNKTSTAWGTNASLLHEALGS